MESDQITEQTPEQPPADAAPAGEPRLRVARKQPCPCGSGKKFKNCCIDNPAYELINDAAVNTGALPAHPVAAAAPKTVNSQKHFPPHQQKNLPSARQSNSTHSRRV